MRKNHVRILSLLVAVVLAMTLLPLSALAASVDVFGGISDKENPDLHDVSIMGPFDTEAGRGPVTIKTSDYDSYIIAGGDDYDLKGIIDLSKALHRPRKDLDPQSSLTFRHDGMAMLLYVPHAHKLSCWISDGTTHWRNCKVCKDQFVYQNWCQDGDEDGICNVCGGDVPYHDVTVVEEEGATITVNKETASHRTKITADVEVKDGYKLQGLHFIKVRDNGTQQEITRYKNSGQFWTYMPTYDLEVVAEVVKK